MEEFFKLNDDEDGDIRDLVMESRDDPYKNHDIDTWWLDLPDDKKYIFKFLGALALNPTWDLEYRLMNVTDVSNKEKKGWYIPCFCPCHQRYRNYLGKMGACHILDDNKVTPCTNDKSFTQPESFKAHLHDVKDWTHFLLYHFVIQLHEIKPTAYTKEKIKPIPSSALTQYVLKNNLDSDTHEVIG